MWSNFIILHKENPKCTLPSPRPHYSWSTCLRTLAFYDFSLLSKKDYNLLLKNFSAQKTENSSWTMYKSWDAYKFLLEVILGLHSHILGETEVMFQFKNSFKDEELSNIEIKNYLQKLRNSLLSDAKIIRSQYMNNLGSQSYAGIARSLTKKAKKVYILGHGVLSTKIIPYLRKKKEVYIIGRNEEKLKDYSKDFNVVSYSLTELMNLELDKNSAFIIAAKIPKFAPYLKILKPSSVLIDFRSFHEDSLNLFYNYSYYSLNDIYKTRVKNEEQRVKILFQLSSIIEEVISTTTLNKLAPSFEQAFKNVTYTDYLKKQECLIA